ESYYSQSIYSSIDWDHSSSLRSIFKKSKNGLFWSGLFQFSLK
ncbi:8154_t:CDS:1, partial [Dentiscutata erythropus]